jgi:NADH dehydrogenase (ubiquinone) 1 alpha subcomplex subunit 5
VGIAVEAEPHKKLVGLYTQTLEALKQIPEEAEYRKSVEKVTAHRLSIVKSEPLVSAIEQ